MRVAVLPGGTAAALADALASDGLDGCAGAVTARADLAARARAGSDATAPPPGVHADVWALEQLRLAVAQANALAAVLAPLCACTTMSAGGAEAYLCAAHGAPRECRALDYTTHTLDGATALLYGDALAGPPPAEPLPPASLAALAALARRLYRILAHAAACHAAAFATFEASTRCSARLTAACRARGLLSDEQSAALIPAALLAAPRPPAASPPALASAPATGGAV